MDTVGVAVFIGKNTLYNLNWGFGYLYKNYLRIIGSKGTIISEPFFSKPSCLTPYIKIYKNKKFNKILFSKTNHFLNMLDSFSDTIKNKNKINNHLKKCLVQSKLINELRIKK